MTRTEAIVVTLVAYKVVLLAIGLWARGRTRTHGEFFLGGRQMGGLVAAISASASSSSAWTLVAVSGSAYLWGLPALWLFPATVSGFVINWCWVGPRLMRASRENGALTLTEFLALGVEPVHRRRVLLFGAGIVLFSFLFYVASQFQAAGNAFSSTFGLGTATSILVGAAIILVYTLLGGFWAVSVTDTLQGLLMAATAVFLPVTAFVAAGGWEGLAAGLTTTGESPVPVAGIAAVGFVLGTLGIGLGYPGQPHVVNRYMALKDEEALRRGRAIALTWAVIIYAGMLLLGLSARVLFEGVESESVLYDTANRLLSPVVAGVVIAAVLSAIMSTADSQLLVAASAVSHDLGEAQAHRETALARSRWVVAILATLAVVLAVAVPDTVFNRVLFAWHAIGSAFGPALVLRLAGRHLPGRTLLASMAVGFFGTVILHWLPNTPGDVAERLLPLVGAAAVAFRGSRRAPVA